LPSPSKRRAAIPAASRQAVVQPGHDEGAGFVGTDGRPRLERARLARHRELGAQRLALPIEPAGEDPSASPGPAPDHTTTNPSAVRATRAPYW
jgi:hypothetical protein